jgi:hypothetical protein
MDAGSGKREDGTGQQQRNPEASAVGNGIGIGTILRKAWQIDLHLQDRFTSTKSIYSQRPCVCQHPAGTRWDTVIVKHL